MTDKHNAVIVSVLAAVLVVGVAGLYLTSKAPAASLQTVVYQAGPVREVAVPARLPVVNAFGRLSKSFSIVGVGDLAGLEVAQNGTGNITFDSTFDMRMDKSTIVCRAKVIQGTAGDDVDIYTCGDVGSNGVEWVTCDDYRVFQNSSFPAPSGAYFPNGDLTINSATCDVTNTSAAPGAFIVRNHGKVAKLNATLLSYTLDGNDLNTSAWVDDYFFNDALGGTGTACTGACYTCSGPDTAGCNKIISSATAGAGDIPADALESVEECTRFETSSVGICQCQSLHIRDNDDVHQLRNGKIVRFKILKTFIDNPASSCV